MAFEDHDRFALRYRAEQAPRPHVIRCAPSGMLPANRANSPGCGVSMRGPPGFASASFRSASANNASASTTIGWLISRYKSTTRSMRLGRRPSPGPSATAVAFCAKPMIGFSRSLCDVVIIVGESGRHVRRLDRSDDVQHAIWHGECHEPGAAAKRRLAGIAKSRRSFRAIRRLSSARPKSPLWLSASRGRRWQGRQR